MLPEPTIIVSYDGAHGPPGMVIRELHDTIAAMHEKIVALRRALNATIDAEHQWCERCRTNEADAVRLSRALDAMPQDEWEELAHESKTTS